MITCAYKSCHLLIKIGNDLNSPILNDAESRLKTLMNILAHSNFNDWDYMDQDIGMLKT